jgi:transcriptional regulator
VRRTPSYLLTEPDEVKRLIRENSWATMVSNTSVGLVASHYPVVLEEDVEGISIVSHVGRPDEKLHELGQHEMLVIIQGAHGYVSPTWYKKEGVPTWNHVTAHLYGVPEILSDDENYRVLGDLVDYFELRMPKPARLEYNEEYARRIVHGTVGIRLRVTRFDARLKLSQEVLPEQIDLIIDALETDEHYRNPRLAREMRRVRDSSGASSGEVRHPSDS